ncbi:ABC transporter permease [Pseudothauera rhizosphaerae]|uniref:Pyoverdine export ATP-binding/permease protein PvdT n=1 Tax=Pseudothauera rhizosphaerae TaxID=2565932 RepID=A0A4S4ARQ9_9RHOO|nr:ABC transporter permease [Pseudothauera rhizosphaerae]THF62533.1 ATP-binding cassette domain-containing protein [Pseudothauera rhizosphaerae]
MVAAAAESEPPPLIELADIRKSYGGEGGEASVEILHGISLTIRVGEFVALVGASGSGKSTLMHILGCLDKPTSGRYRFAGRDIAGFDADELAWLRREAFGFVFQGYHLIRTLDALHNVQVPAVYAGMSAAEREARAAVLLERLGLAGRAGHRPNQLSGGQQQRVSIARALMNGGHVILADEPTGALDSKSGTEVMALLRELADAGHTVIVITHDPQVAAQARRVVRISDGHLVGDTMNEGANGAVEAAAVPPSLDSAHFMERMALGVAHGASWVADAREAVAGAWRTLWVSRFRTVLTLLGIVIGVASVIVLMAVGQGASEQMLEKMAAFGNTHRMSIRPGTDSARGVRGLLSVVDVQLVRDVPNVDIAMPFLTGSAMLRAGNVDAFTQLWSTSHEGMRLFNWSLARGIFFSAADEAQLATVAVLGKQASERLFADTDPVGQYVLVDNAPFRVIGQLAETGDADGDNLVVIPFSTASRRVLGTPYPGLIQVKVHDPDRIGQTVEDITAVLEKAHRVRDFNIANNPARARAQNEATRQQNLLLALIAGISLVVGGIGVMNIMLMAVKERTREIGIRMATGARQRDIQRQFLTEAVMVSLVGGAAGVAAGLAVGVALILWDVPVIFSIRAMLLAFGCAVATGLVFGFMPARQAARLDPVVALAGE